MREVSLQISPGVFIRFAFTDDMLRQALGLDAGQIGMLRAVVEDLIGVDPATQPPEEIAILVEQALTKRLERQLR